MSRRRMILMNEQEEEKVKEWVTIVDTVTTEEFQNPVYDALPDGSKIENYDFREVAAYVYYNANEAQATSGYIKLQLTDVNGNIASVQTTRGIQKTGYYRAVLNVQLGNTFNLCDAQDSVNTSLSKATIYDSTETILSTLKKISIISYANIGAGSKIKIMAR